MWRHEKGKKWKRFEIERYARDTHYACLWLEAMALFNPRRLQLTDSARMIEWWTFIFVFSGFRQRNASAAEVRRSNRNATFQRHDRTWLDVGRCQACGIHRARSVTVDSQQETSRNNQSQGLVTTHV